MSLQPLCVISVLPSTMFAWDTRLWPTGVSISSITLATGLEVVRDDDAVAGDAVVTLEHVHALVRARSQRAIAFGVGFCRGCSRKRDQNNGRHQEQQGKRDKTLHMAARP